MNDKELIKKIEEIVFFMPDGIYKFLPPEDCFDQQWEEASIQEKAFLLIEELLLNTNRDKLKQNKQEESDDDLEIEIPYGPRFYNKVDERMFFDGLNSIPSLRCIKGNERGLFLYFKSALTCEEKEFLKGLLKRYQVSIPQDILI